MQKKLIAVAVAGALGAPAVVLAQASTVQIYGRLNIEYAYADQGAGRRKVDHMNAPGSAIGFRGEEKLGGGMSAWFQCESTADPRGPNGGASNGVFCSRNSAIGFKGAFGNVFLGTWDTPFKRTLGPNIVGAEQTGHWGVIELLSSNSTSVADNTNRDVFMRRQRNSINYDSPNFAGFQVLAAFSSTNGATASTPVFDQKARVFSLGAQYRAGPLYISGAYERHNEFAVLTGLNNFDDDEGWHIGANYTFAGRVKIGGLWTRNTFPSTNLLGDIDYDAFHVGVDWNIQGPHGILASYTRVDDADGAPGAVGPGGARPNVPVATIPNDTGADMWTIRYYYNFSKRTQFRIGYSRIENDSQARYRLTALARPGTTVPTGLGDNQSAFGITIDHRF